MGLMSQKVEALAHDLVSQGKITSDQLAVAHESQKNLGGHLGDILVRRGYISETDLFKALAKKFKYTVISLKTYKPDPDVIRLLTPAQANRWQVIPLFKVEDKITVATANPFNLSVLDEMHVEFDEQIEFVLSPSSEIEEALKKYYSSVLMDSKLKQVEIVKNNIANLTAESSPLVQLEREARGSKVISTVDKIFIQAFDLRASDIHLEPSRNAFKVRLRVDGILEEIAALEKNMHQSVVSRIKILANMDVAEQRVPQDERIRVRIQGQEIDLRVASYPTQFGETITIRFLLKEGLLTLEDLGLPEKNKKRFEQVIKQPYGIFLVTGPTGSGKTTTLYAALKKINRHDKNVLSIEDPIENEIDGVNQTGINIKAGMTFASAIRAMMRQDPDVILVGEIRDHETAEIAMRAAMTGHFVYSTLHTNTATGAITRLINLGVEPYLISSSLSGVMAQRLVRKICTNCKVEQKSSDVDPQLLGLQQIDFKTYKGRGCRNCRMTGYSGRIGIFELFTVDDAIREMILGKMPQNEIQNYLRAQGHYTTLLEDGVDKVKQGITTLDEVLRVAVAL